MVVVTESEEDKIIVLDLEGTILLNPSQLNVKQIETALRERAYSHQAKD